MPYRWLNDRNPDVRTAAIVYRQHHGISQWDPLTPEQMTEFELDFMQRYMLSEYKRDYLYPFFLNPNTGKDVGAAYVQYKLDCGIGYHSMRDTERDNFERQFAAGKVKEYEEYIRAVNPAVS